MITPKHTFFCPELDKGTLSEDESNHAARVLRLKENDYIRLVDGKGTSALAQLTVVQKRKVQFKIVEQETTSTDCTPIHIAIAPTKNFDRFSFFLEKVTELGCQEITPIFSSNSERKSLRIDKSKKVMVAGLKQSGNLFLPELNEPIALKDLLSQELDYDLKLIAHCEDDENKKDLKDYIKNHQSILILIGPEGDFTSEEIKLAKEKGFISVNLGVSRLRTETAGILACHTVYLFS